MTGALARFSGWTGIDMSAYDLDTPLKSVGTKAAQSMVDMFSKADPDRDWTPRESRRIPGRRRHRMPPSSAPRKRSPLNCAAGATRRTLTGSTSATPPSPAAGKSSSNSPFPNCAPRDIVSPARAEDQEPVTLREKLFPGHKYTLDTPPRHRTPHQAAHQQPATDRARHHERSAEIPMTEQTDVVVIGAGVAGLITARELATAATTWLSSKPATASAAACGPIAAWARTWRSAATGCTGPSLMSGPRSPATGSRSPAARARRKRSGWPATRCAAATWTTSWN